MDIRDYSSQFTIYVFTSDVDRGASTKVYLSQAGYDVYFFQDPETLEQRLQENPPHILVFSTAGLSGSLNDFVHYVLELCPDIKFIILNSPDQFDVLSQYSDFGVMDIVSEDPVALESRVVWAVNRACEKLYLTYQNEQLFADLRRHEQELQDKASMPVQAPAAESPPPPPPPFSLTLRLADYKSAESKEDLIQRFLNNLDGLPCVFFKYLPTVKSFMATHASGFDGAMIQGVGCQLDSQELKELGGQMAVGQLPSRFALMLAEAFHFNPPRPLPLYTLVFEGVLVSSAQLKPDQANRLQEEFALFAVCYSNMVLEKKVDLLEVQDFVTEIYNRNYYFKVLANEFERARRLTKPLSVVKVSLDDFYEIESSLGEAVRDELLKGLAGAITKTSRTNDVTCRTGLNEMALILPHCSKNGAALRAERLRRIVEGTAFLDNGMKISVSVGISEYPTLCDSVKALDETATKALLHIADKGGNKICLYKAAPDHQPEFQVEEG